MRITGGIARGIQLRKPTGTEVRPATDYLREALFSSLSEKIQEARVLDLFAGTGAYGLECLSRGASEVHFVDRGRKVLEVLRQNLEAVAKSVGVDPFTAAEVIGSDLRKWQPDGETRYDVIFADPPYPQAFALLQGMSGWIEGALNEGGLWIVECPVELWSPSAEWGCSKTLGGRGRGDPTLRLFELRD